jgi:hypothetical protein
MLAPQSVQGWALRSAGRIAAPSAGQYTVARPSRRENDTDNAADDDKANKAYCKLADQPPVPECGDSLHDDLLMWCGAALVYPDSVQLVVVAWGTTGEADRETLAALVATSTSAWRAMWACRSCW